MSSEQKSESSSQMRWERVGALFLLFALLGSISILTIHTLYDPDIWWHLKVGDWIRHTHQVPHTGIFSRTAAEHSWVAYSWGYEVQLSLFYSAFGLIGLAVNGLLLTMLVLVATFWSIFHLSERFWFSIILAGIGGYATAFTMFPRPVFFSMMFLAILITLLLEAQHSGVTRFGYWLPLLFCLWANLHIQFVYGLFVLGLFVAAHSFRRLLEVRGRRAAILEPSARLPLGRLWLIFALCLIAGCIGPYGSRLYYVVFEYSRAKYTYGMITELFAPAFDQAYEYFGLFLAAAGFYAVGWRKRIDPFKFLLLVIAALAAFRTARDEWFLSLVSLAVIGDALRDEKPRELGLHMLEFAAAGLMVFCCLFLVGKNAGVTTRGLDRTAATIFPVNAANFIRQNSFPGPIFNSFDWGGFLIWYLPQYPVSIDGRNDLYGDKLDERLYSVEGSDRPYNEEPLFADARLILLEPYVPLARALQTDPAYETVYRDRQAVVYVRRAD